MAQETKTNTLTKRDIHKLFWYSQAFVSGFNYEKEEAPGFVFSMMPVIEKVYDNDEEKRDAYRRHTDLFLTEAHLAHLVIGITAAMEEQNANNEDFDADSINSVKTALMGPLAGVGDSLYHGTLRPLIAGLCVSMIAASGYTSALGSILFVLIMGGVGLALRYFGIVKGYEKGVSLVATLQSSGIIQRLTKYAGIVACIVIGGWIPSLVWLSIPWSYTAGETVVSLQATLDSMMPNVLPLCVTLICYKLLNKKMSPVVLMLLLMVVGVILHALGILA